jgi:hypothetical protein
MGEGRLLKGLVTTGVMEVAAGSSHFVNGFCPLFVVVTAVYLCNALFHVTACVLLQGSASYFSPFSARGWQQRKRLIHHSSKYSFVSKQRTSVRCKINM